MRYEGTVYRPPSEAGSLLIQATIGCPHNRCTFCDMYKGTKYRARPLAEVIEDLESALADCGDGVYTIFLPDANTILLPTDTLVAICEKARALFPHLERVTVYGSARFIARKSLAELIRLRAAGLSRIHTGMESGDAEVLSRIKKGADPEEIVRAGRMVREAGIEQSEYVLVGIGGRERWREHAEGSARVLSAIDPEFIRLRTYIPRPGTPLFEEWRAGRFEVLSAYEALAETRLLVERLTCGSALLSDHLSNFWDVHGKLPEDQDAILAELDHALTLDRSRFRPPTEDLVYIAGL
jgi:radical SAM superfamily enzyme YgiQ (UPF0313 family)